ncbi:MAG: GNAT family N-acetyltransferase [Candidatus Cloacimonetes bacterium]|nr:GNAT family N-acetyltransferase [Candidatus Cloacimonadota bacterium]
MIFIKSNVQELKKLEIFKLTIARFQENIDRIFDEKDLIYFIIEDNKEIGFFYQNEFQYKYSFRMFIAETQKRFDIIEFKRLILEIIKDEDSKNFVEFSLQRNSKNILNKFNRIDAMLEYQRDSYVFRSLNSINSKFTIYDKIDDYEELTEFLYLAFEDDEEYCKADWKSMMESFPKASFPHITYLCKKKDKIVGACIGYNIISLKKIYLYVIAVYPEYRKNHIGEHLIKLFLNSKQEIPFYLDVLESAKPAISLYEKVGFRKKKIVSAICLIDKFLL